MASMEKLGRKLTIRANSASAHSNVYRVLSSMSDKGRADFLEATTGVRFLPLANDIHSRITVSLLVFFAFDVADSQWDAALSLGRCQSL